MKTKTVRFRVTEEESNALRHLAKRRKTAVSTLITLALDALLPTWRKTSKTVPK